MGAPVRGLKRTAVSSGISDFTRSYGITGGVTDSTQMMLFTAEGLLRAYVRGSSRGICHVPSIIHHVLCGG
ncbi:hypothetical protein [Pseudomonas sp. FDAARGOS_380]|uniref:hypothetical protein n=1 Tax=Pseudomonas sp. FDAARGOS_380 TaxID=2018067 RepID=UPI00353073BB